MWRRIQVSLKSDKKNGLLYVKTSTHFLIISRSVPFRMRNISDKSCRENQTHILLSVNLFR